MSHPQACRCCGCAEADACFDDERGACWWAEPGLCSHCQDSMALLDELVTGISPNDRVERVTGEVGEINLPMLHAQQLRKILRHLAATEPARTAATRDVLAERARQMAVEGWSLEHDDEHANGELAGAAACYALTTIKHWAAPTAIKMLWPWDQLWWKPESGRQDLVKAGALILAAIERIDRAAIAQEHH